jgi:hypothetical protein
LVGGKVNQLVKSVAADPGRHKLVGVVVELKPFEELGHGGARRSGPGLGGLRLAGDTE